MLKNISLLTILIVFLLSAAVAHADEERSWTSIGAAGSVTPSQLSLVEHSTNAARIPSNINSGTVTLRYNVTAVDGLFPGGIVLTNFAFGARYIDNGASSRVQWRLRSYSHDSGALTTIATADSNTMPQNSAVQSSFECIAVNFDFSQNSYFVEVVLSKTALAGRAQISSVRLVPTVCFIAP